MNRYVLRTSLVWIAVLAVVAGIWAYRSHVGKQPIAMKMPMSGDVQPVASGPPADANEPVPSMPGTKTETPLIPVQPANYTFQWSGEYELELRAKQRLQLILPVVFFVIFLLLYMVFHSVAEALVLIFPTIYAMSGGLLLQWLLRYNFSVAVALGYIALFGIAVETGVVMVVYLHEALEHKLQDGRPLTNADVEEAAIEGAVQRLRPKLMTVCAVLASLVPILWESGIGSDVMKPIAAPIVGGMITSTVHVLILVPVFFVMMKERALKRGTLNPPSTTL
jgi:copper/silver efflux system protein